MTLITQSSHDRLWHLVESQANPLELRLEALRELVASHRNVWLLASDTALFRNLAADDKQPAELRELARQAGNGELLKPSVTCPECGEIHRFQDKVECPPEPSEFNKRLYLADIAYEEWRDS